MKWAGRVAALLAMIAALAAAPWAAARTVTGLKDMLKTPRPAWEGVLSTAVVPAFPTVNLNGWLQAQGRAFEQAHGSVLISLREMTEEGVHAGAAAANLPDALFFGAGVFSQPQSLFLPLRGAPPVREELQSVGCQDGARYAVPLALGGYGLLGNRALLDAAGWHPGLGLAGTVDLMETRGLRAACPSMPYTHPLRAFAAMGGGDSLAQSDLPHAKIWPDYALEDRYAFYLATQREVRRMDTLRRSGGGFDTVLLTPERGAYTDQILLGGVVRPELTASGEGADALYRAQWAGRFFDALLTEEAQRGLAQAWLFPVTAVHGVYEEGTDMAQLERSLRDGLQTASAFDDLRLNSSQE